MTEIELPMVIQLNDTDQHVTEITPVIHPGPGPRRLWLEITPTEER